MLSGERRGPIDLERLVIDRTARQQLTGLRNVADAGNFYEGLLPSPVRELANPRVPTPQPSTKATIGPIERPGVTVGL